MMVKLKQVISGELVVNANKKNKMYNLDSTLPKEHLHCN